MTGKFAFGQAGFLHRQAAEKQPLAIERFATEVKRTLGVLDGVLATRPVVADAEFTIADIAQFGWLWRREFAGVDLETALNMARWYAALESRPAVGRAIRRVTGLMPQA